MPEAPSEAGQAELLVREADRAVPVDLLRALAHFAEAPSDVTPRLSEALGFRSSPTSVEYSDLFLFQLYPYSSVHVGPEGMLGGEARDRAAGLWRALGRSPPAEPDHLASLLGIFATLAEEEALQSGAERRLVESSRKTMLWEHLGTWVPHFCSRVQELTSGVYADWADLLYRTILEQFERTGHPDRVPIALADVPGVPDPRTEGGADFVAALLAPARAGMILTRADLARIANEVDAGLRAGERRYALEHLLAQAPVGVLRKLAVEADRQADDHLGRVGTLGPLAQFFSERAGQTASGLRSLAEGVEVDGAGSA